MTTAFDRALTGARESVSRAVRSRRYWVGLVVGIQALLMLAGWFAAIHFARQAASRERELLGGPAGAITGLPSVAPGAAVIQSPVFTLVMGGITLIVVISTGLVTAILLRKHDEDMDDINAGLEDEIKNRVTHAVGIRNAIITGLAKLADFRDTDTGAHLDRIASYSAILARELQTQGNLHTSSPGRTRPIDAHWIAMLRIASTMHDIGKVGVSDAILLKPGKLTESERAGMQLHPMIGSDTLMAVREKIGEDALLEMCIRVTLYHHERWDGTGYPMRLAGDAIPLEARIVALADVYDALTSQRVYKAAIPHEQAVDMIAEQSGKHFDPDVVRAFRAVAKAFAEEKVRWSRKPVQETVTGG